MTWSLRYSTKAERQLAKLDAQQSRIIVAWLTKNIDCCQDPRTLGSPLTADHKGKWRYRVGNCRVLVEIQDSSLIVLALQIGHRRDIHSR